MQLELVLEKLKQQLEEKGREINEFKEKHKIIVQGEDEEPKKDKTKKEKTSSETGVLVGK